MDVNWMLCGLCRLELHTNAAKQRESVGKAKGATAGSHLSAVFVQTLALSSSLRCLCSDLLNTGYSNKPLVFLSEGWLEITLC